MTKKLSSSPITSRTEFSEESASKADYGVKNYNQIYNIKISRSPMKGRIVNFAEEQDRKTKNSLRKIGDHIRKMLHWNIGTVLSISTTSPIRTSSYTSFYADYLAWRMKDYILNSLDLVIRVQLMTSKEINSHSKMFTYICLKIPTLKGYKRNYKNWWFVVINILI